MADTIAEVEAIFRQVVEACLVKQMPQLIYPLLAEDMIGIGMGEQGIVTCREDAESILGNGREVKQQVEIHYVSLQTRCFEERYATVCGVLNIRQGGKAVSSTLGQMMNLRREQGTWLIYTMQATPLFQQIEEMEAYPLKFAENVLETYRQQERIAKNAYSDSVGIYLINFTKGVFDNAVLMNDIVVRTEKGDPYEKTIFDAARKFMRTDDERYAFISTFSLGNVIQAYQSGLTELSMEYEMVISPKKSLWMKSIVKLYTDKQDEQLKGYLYVLDIDEVKRRELELRSKAELDSMTGLYNKRFAESKAVELLNSLIPGECCAFFMIDLDCFKQINDTYGHQEGDRVIQETARFLQGLIRRGDVAGRIGGDEFCVCFGGGLAEETVKEKAEDLCLAVRGLIPREQGGTTCSVGIAFGRAGVDFGTLYKNADVAMYQRKRSGRNGYTVYEN